MPSHGRDENAGPSNGEPSTKRQKPSSIEQANGHSKGRLAFLGPVGTYGHQAATRFSKALFDSPPELLPCPTIGSVWDADAEYLVLPLENTIGGGVRETLSCMVTNPGDRRELEASGSNTATFQPDLDPPSIVADLDLRVDHSLIVRRGTKLSDIRWVKSHEQALAQCAAYLRKTLPDTTRIPCSSTAAATASLLEPDDSEAGAGAAIASKASIRDNPELEVLSESIQAVKHNNTRFLLFKRNRPPLAVPSALLETLPVCPYTEWFILENETQLGDLLQRTQGRLATILVVPHPHTSPPKHKYPKSMVIELETSLSVKEHDELIRIGVRRYHVEA